MIWSTHSIWLFLSKFDYIGLDWSCSFYFRNVPFQHDRSITKSSSSSGLVAGHYIAMYITIALCYTHLIHHQVLDALRFIVCIAFHWMHPYCILNKALLGIPMMWASSGDSSLRGLRHSTWLNFFMMALLRLSGSHSICCSQYNVKYFKWLYS
jgi:hypothetical protein